MIFFVFFYYHHLEIYLLYFFVYYLILKIQNIFKINKLKQEIGLLKLKAELLMKKDVFEHSSQNCKIRKGKLVYLPHKI